MTIGVFFTIMFYCVVWITRIQGSTWPWQVVAPGMVELATLSAVISFFSFNFGLWPAYGFLTPLVVFTLFLGGAMIFHFVPFL